VTFSREEGEREEEGILLGLGSGGREGTPLLDPHLDLWGSSPQHPGKRSLISTFLLP
jgi:hypothetical protein